MSVASVTTDAPGRTQVMTATVTTAGGQHYGDSVTLGTAVTFSAGGASSSAALDNGGNLLSIATSGTWDAAGAISGTGGLTKSGSGTLTLSGPNANTYAGLTRVTDGTLQLNKSAGSGSVAGELIVGDDVGGAASAVVRLLSHSQIADTSAVTVNSDGVFEVADPTDGDFIGSLTVNGATSTSSARPAASNWAEHCPCPAASSLPTPAPRSPSTATSSRPRTPAATRRPSRRRGRGSAPVSRTFTVNDGPAAIDLSVGSAITAGR